MEAPQRAGCPPVRLAGQAHEGRDEHAPDQRGVHQHGQRQAHAEQLHERDPRGGEGDEDNGQQGGGGGDDPAGLLEPGGHRLGRAGPGVVLLLDAGQEENLVIHRQPESDTEHEDGHGHEQRPGGGEAEQTGAVALLEDEHHRPEGGGEREEVEHDGLGRHEQAAEHGEQHDQRDEGDDAAGQREPGAERRLGVDHRRRLPPDQNPGGPRRRHGPHRLGQPLARPAEPLRWELQPAAHEGDDYRLRLVQANGEPAPIFACVLPGEPALYVTEQAVFMGPSHQDRLLDPARENRIPAPALEHAEGVAFLQSLGAELPPRIRERLRLLPYQVAIGCQLKKLYPESNAEECIFSVVAEAPDGHRHPVVGVPEPHPEERRPEHQQDDDDGGGAPDGPPHDRARQPVPEPVG